MQMRVAVAGWQTQSSGCIAEEGLLRQSVNGIDDPPEGRCR